MTYPYMPGYSGHMSGDNGDITRIVIHATCSATVNGGAVNNAHYFQDPNSGGLAHYVVDPGNIVQCCPENTACWHAPPNHGSVGIELTDPEGAENIQSGASDPHRWGNPDHEKMLALGARLTWEIASRHNIPLVRVSAADLVSGKRGVCGHVDVSQAFHQSDHNDPGSDFPWAHFMDLVHAHGAVQAAYVPPANDAPAKHPWPLAPNAVVHLNNAHPLVDTVARYLKQPVDPNHVYTSFMATAVAHWQDRMHIPTHPAGILNEQTWQAMR
jgi:N-acetyl-anhydromuramyl-L-alanine amidase AmpD